MLWLYKGKEKRGCRIIPDIILLISIFKNKPCGLVILAVTKLNDFRFTELNQVNKWRGNGQLQRRTLQVRITFASSQLQMTAPRILFGGRKFLFCEGHWRNWFHYCLHWLVSRAADLPTTILTWLRHKLHFMIFLSY